MIGAYIASMVVTLVQYVRLRDRRLLPLLALFAFQTLALTRDWWDYKKEVLQTASCAAGLVLLLMLTLRRPSPGELPRPDAPRPDAPPAP
ncbi:MAG TPA: hypothetical protein VLF95_07765 [Vicinamibacteria bacterium]|nr:hypothetical protein [Vicinamibacteria bacterium]